MRVRRLTLLVTAIVVLAAPAAAAEDVLGVDVYPDRVPTTNASEKVHLVGHDPGERYNWTVTVTDDYHVVELVVHDGFDVSRGRQMVPLVGGDHFIELHDRNVTAVDRPATVYNLTERQGAWVYRLGLPGPGERNLTLHRDVTPPEVTMGPVRNITHVSFDVKTRTSEPALAELVLEKPDGSTREQPTPRPGIWQRFPVQGLDADTTYRFHVRVWDWSGNDNRTGTATLTTEPEPDPPEPTVRPLTPEPDATVDGAGGVVVSASFEANGSRVVTDGIRLFFDKEPVDRRNLTIRDGRVSYNAPGPLEPRPYSVSLEVPNEAGGVGVARWSFTVEGATTAESPLGAPLALLALAGSGAAIRARRGS